MRRLPPLLRWSRSGAREEHEGRTVEVLTRFARRYPRQSLIVVGLLVLAGLSEGLGIASLLPLVEMATAGESPGAVEAEGLSAIIRDLISATGIEPSIGVLLGLIVLGIALRSGLTLLGMLASGNAAADVAMDLRIDLIRALMAARWEHFTSRSLGSIANAVSSEATIAASFYSVATMLCASLLQVLVYAVLVILVAGRVAVSAVIFALVLFVALNFLITMAREAGMQRTERLKSLTSRLTDGLGVIKPLKAMAREDSLGPLLEDEAESLNLAQRRQVLAGHALPAFHEPLVTGFVAFGVYAFLTWFEVGFDEMLFIAFLFYRTVTRVGTLQLQYQKLAGPEAAFWSIESAIREAEEAQEPNPGQATPTLDEAIEFEDVSFGYGDALVLEHANFIIPARSLTAVVGPSGIGKTTVADLLIGLYQPQRGDVRIDGLPLAEIDLRKWRSRIGYVPQETVLFNDSVLINVTLRDERYSADDVEAALRAADAWDFVSGLPHGMDTVVGERGARLSGGQRQRLAIARALIRQPVLLILDEATTALDPETERAVCQTISNLTDVVTVLAISHQPAIVSVADHVIRLSDLRAARPTPLDPSHSSAT